MIKTNLIESKKYSPQKIVKDILKIIPYNYRYSNSYLKLAKLIYDDYHLNEVSDILFISNDLFYKEYGIKLDTSNGFEFTKDEYLDITFENTIHRAIIDNDKERFICFTEQEGFDEKQKVKSRLYPFSPSGYSLLELCCYHGAVDCFKFLRTKFNSEITQCCLEFSFLGGNQDIMGECLKRQKPDFECMKYAIISHNIDFVSFLMNEYNIKINLDSCITYNNLEAFFVYFDQPNDFNYFFHDRRLIPFFTEYTLFSRTTICFIYSTMFNIPSLCEYFLSHGADINEKEKHGYTALHCAVNNNSKEMCELLLSHGADINSKDKNGCTALHCAVANNSKKICEFLLCHDANINEKDKWGYTALHCAVNNNSKEMCEFLLSHGADINSKDKNGCTALHCAVANNSKKICEFLLCHDANINEKDKWGYTALHIAVNFGYKEIVMLLLSYEINIKEEDNRHKTAFQYAKRNSEIEELFLLFYPNIKTNRINKEKTDRKAFFSLYNEDDEDFIDNYKFS